MECFSKIANNTLDCTRKCDANARGEHEVLREGQSYELDYDSRCIYKVDLKNKVAKTKPKLVAPAELFDEFSSKLKDEFNFDDNDRRMLQLIVSDDDELPIFIDEIATQPGVDIFISSEDFL